MRLRRIVTLMPRALPLVVLAACGGSKAGERRGIACDEPATIAVVANGLAHTNGEVRMALFAVSEGFPGEPEKALQSGKAKVEGDVATYVFEPVPCGRYAVSVFHDEDGDGEMKRDWLGRPKEGWGVTHDATGRFGPPSFEDASFDADAPRVQVSLNLRYE